MSTLHVIIMHSDHANKFPCYGKYNLGMRFHIGYMVVQDYNKAINLYKQSLNYYDKLNEYAMYHIASIYDDNNYKGMDHDEAIKWKFLASTYKLYYGNILDYNDNTFET